MLQCLDRVHLRLGGQAGQELFSVDTLPFVVSCCPRWTRGSSPTRSSFGLGYPARLLVLEGGAPRCSGRLEEANKVRLTACDSSPTPRLPCLIAHASSLRSSDGKFGSTHEVLNSELLAYPFDDANPTVAYVELGQSDEQKVQRVSRNLSPSPNTHPHPHPHSHRHPNSHPDPRCLLRSA